MSETSLSPRRTPSNDPRRPTKTAWVYRQPPADPTARIEFRLTRMRLVLLYHVTRDMAALRREIESVSPPTARRRQWQREYRALVGDFEYLKRCARFQRIYLRRLRDETPAMAWLRRQLGTLERPQ